MDRLPTAETAGAPTYLMNAIVVNQPLLTVRSGAIEVSVREWNRMLEEYVAGSAVLVKRVERETPLNGVNFVRLLCPVLSSRGFCEADEPIVDRRVYTYGWDLYRIGDDATGSRESGPAAGG
jgi:hypothetical protein